jgi:AcrR family transcriptional regulator
MATTARRRQPRRPIEVRREEVLDAALRLIDREGYAAATMEAISREADLAKPVVYNAFPGRGPLLRALLDREEAKARQALMEAAPPDRGGIADPRLALTVWSERLLDAILNDPAAWRLMLLHRAEAPLEVRDRFAKGRALAQSQVQTLLDAYLDQLGRRDIDAELAAELLLAAFERGAALMLEAPDRFPPQRLVATVQQALGALPAQPGRA